MTSTAGAREILLGDEKWRNRTFLAAWVVTLVILEVW
ncbi:MAG: hypothetical protein Hyperionvirus5_124 [Hyperionvirus sp.]|uniref:Uncharacterized protein n=1 Tax=Hyperionvirus sp. TaxID=2487770 RepID=A0A3G5A809_9VIRU|nr:MAG: hypothetical protein Hyperionvirus5_124 [Hyperionvirus sp.]